MPDEERARAGTEARRGSARKAWPYRRAAGVGGGFCVFAELAVFSALGSRARGGVLGAVVILGREERSVGMICLWSVAANGVLLGLWKSQIKLDYRVCQSAAAFFSKRRKKGSLRAIGDGTWRRDELGWSRTVPPHLWCSRGIGLAGHAPTPTRTARAPAAMRTELGAGAS